MILRTPSYHASRKDKAMSKEAEEKPQTARDEARCDKRLVLGMHTRDFAFAHVLEESSGRRFRWDKSGDVVQIVGGSDTTDSHWRKAGVRDAERIRNFISENDKDRDEG